MDRAAESLLAELRRLAARLTAGQDPDPYMPSGPLIVDWHEPLLYQYLATARVERLAEDYDAAVVTRAACCWPRQAGRSPTR
ncbi:hypothetical protein [Streptomyces sp. ME19-01-6]|uniref:hypothetical protein n=1 Tax=Streptomyces sp. ME19-01-6 TaxID=3028686 RepID=UPI0029A605EB|nr:hypothetical protein [Streptomyces sp. ME19-01-6]MDX3229213.1 hypothetical protein [Streptomyces sp. ME19-01-6]